KNLCKQHFYKKTHFTANRCKIKNHDFSEKNDRPFFIFGHFKNVHFQKTSTTFFLHFFNDFIRTLKK
ncbi:MAG: hypothetical protein EBZ05_06165, partial [Verrucomicrobia bacterium]|nr:hypothetical protein [Verrucomicrobiota bacterium]